MVGDSEVAVATVTAMKTPAVDIAQVSFLHPGRAQLNRRAS